MDIAEHRQQSFDSGEHFGRTTALRDLLNVLDPDATWRVGVVCRVEDVAAAINEHYARVEPADPTREALLSLEDDAVAARYQLMDVGRALMTALLGNHSPFGQARAMRMMHPVIGDWVTETTRATWVGEWDRYRGFGVLLSNVDSGGGGDAVRVQYGPDSVDVCTWDNASFIALPIKRPDWWEDPL